MRTLLLAAFVIASILLSGAAGAQESAGEDRRFEEIVRECIGDVQAGKKYGSEGDNPLQACLVEKKIHTAEVPENPVILQMGTARRGLEPPRILNDGAATNPADSSPGEERDDSFAGGVADTDKALQPASEQAPAETPSVTKRYYLQSGKSGTGAKPIFLNR